MSVSAGASSGQKVSTNEIIGISEPEDYNQVLIYGEYNV